MLPRTGIFLDVRFFISTLGLVGPIQGNGAGLGFALGQPSGQLLPSSSTRLDTRLTGRTITITCACILSTGRLDARVIVGQIVGHFLARFRSAAHLAPP